MQNGHEHFEHLNEVLAHPPGEIAVCAHGINYYYGTGEAQTQVLFENSFEIGRGEIVIMTGPSGSGKTTLLTLIGALRSMQEGQLEIFGKELTGLSPAKQVELRRRIGFIFQHHNLFGSLSAIDNVRLATALTPGTTKEKRDRCAEILTRLGLGERLNYSPNKLSGGQRQRVAIARALVNRPPLVLADEPTAALESHSTQVVMQLLRDLTIGPERSTVLIVTHDQRLIDQADRIVNMVEGRIISNVRTQESIRICSALSKNPELAELHVSASTLTRIAERMAIEFVPPGTAVVEQGTAGNRIFLIGTGVAHATRNDGVFRVLRENDIFGEVTDVSGLLNRETVLAKSELELFVLDKEDLEHVLTMDDNLESQLRMAYWDRQ